MRLHALILPYLARSNYQKWRNLSSYACFISATNSADIAVTRSILPDLIKFAYIPRNQLRINEENQANSSHLSSRGIRSSSPDFGAFAKAGSSSASTLADSEDEHVLVLDFAATKGVGKKAENPA